jgi:hypothetical protein
MKNKSLKQYIIVVRETGEVFKRAGKTQNTYQSLGRARMVAKHASRGDVESGRETLEESCNYFKIVELAPSGVEFNVLED